MTQHVQPLPPHARALAADNPLWGLDAEALRTRMINLLALFAFISCAVCAPWVWAEGQHDIAAAMAVQMVGSPTIWWHNRRGREGTARIIYIALTCLTVGYCASRMPRSAFELLYLLVFSHIFFLFPRKPRALILGSAVVALTWLTTQCIVIPFQLLPPMENEPTTLINGVLALGTAAAMLVALEFGRRQAIVREERLAAVLRQTKDESLLRDKMRAELADREQRLRVVMESVRAAIVNISPSGRIDTVNPTACQLFESEPEKLVGLSVHILFPNDISALRELAAEGGRAVRMEAETLAGEHIPVEVSAERHSDGYTVVVRDLREQLASMAALEQAHHQSADLARTVGMAEVATDVLHNVGNTLNSVNIAATVAADVVRESRAPQLSMVLEVITKHDGDLEQYLRHDARGSRALELATALAERIEEEHVILTAELGQLQDKIEHMKRIVASQQQIASMGGVIEEDVDLVDVMRSALEPYADGLERRNIEVFWKIGDDIPKVRVDRHRVLQILVNFIKNARDAYGPEGGRLELEVSCTATRLLLSVRDNGRGIAPEHLDRVFEHGFTTKRDGHGFGLHSCALTAHALGGTVEASSQGRGKGARFQLQLPRSWTEMMSAQKSQEFEAVRRTSVLRPQ